MPTTRHPASRSGLPSVLLACALALTACGGEPTSVAAPAASRVALSVPAVDGPVPPSPGAPAGAPTAGPATSPERVVPTHPPAAPPAPEAPPAPTRAPLALPAGPATVAPPPPHSAGGLSAVAWAARPLPAGTCSGGTARPVVLGDLDGDGREEAALPVTCPGDTPDAVLLFRGTAAAVVLVGDALPAAERAQLHAVQFRDRHLVVGALAHSTPGRAGEPDLALTLRWQLRGDALERTDRWEDPAEVLRVDEDHVE